MTRRRSGALPKREPNGRHARSALDRLVEAHSPAEVRRLRDAALRGMQAPEWGSELGRLYLAAKLTATQYEAGRRFAILAHEYRLAIGVPDFPATSLGQKAPGRHTEAGVDAARHREAIHHYDEAINALGGYGGPAITILCLVCERDASVSTADALHKLTQGLDALAAHWRIPP